ncbi:reverse transcriptase, partial [Aspergillus luchuensis IFO 4308]
TTHRPLRILQANLRKMPETQLSLLNDTSLKHYYLLLISEPSTMLIEGKLTIHTHQKWTAILPTVGEDEIKKPGMCKSMIWVNRDHPAFQQIDIQSTDITAVIIRPGHRKILVMSVYVPPRTDQQHLGILKERLDMINSVILAQKNQHGPQLEILVAGDFNRHHHLWGGNHVFARHTQRDEAEPILDFMADHNLQSLLPRGTMTFESSRGRSTIDLTLASPELAAQLIRCRVHPREHGSDHRAIQSTFNISVSTPPPYQPRIHLKQAPWDEICTQLTHLQHGIRPLNSEEELDQTVEWLLSEVTQVLSKTCLTGKPSPYCKRWWTPELTKLREEYTKIRNLCTRMRDYGNWWSQLDEEARKRRQRYHTAIRDQKRRHWKEFLLNVDNIWTAARYMVGKSGTAPIPALHSGEDLVEDDKDKAEVLLSAFFPPTPATPEQTLGRRRQSEPLPFPMLTREEVKCAIMKMKPWKVPGQDDLPAVVWQNTWPVTGNLIVAIFRASIRLGYAPKVWRSAKIVVLRKPGKDPSLPKAYRPISLLSTLGKALESIVATRISYLVEKHHLLPENHFGARAGRSCEQALNILVEKIYQAWREGKVLSLVSFDVKGAYNGVAKNVLLERLREHRIPVPIIRWVANFCSQRRASLVVNSFCSDEMEIIHAGLPQGSPLSPILFLFMNANLVNIPISREGGAIAFVDDYTHWTVGESADENTSGATFEADKTSYIHFTRTPRVNPLPPSPLRVGPTPVAPQSTIKVLGVWLDQGLKFKLHAAEAAKKGIRAVLALKRLRGVSPNTARRLFTAMVTSTVDYAASVWCTPKGDVSVPNWVVKALKPIQRYATQAITGAFRSVSLTIAESEASIEPIETRLRKRILRHWIKCHTLPTTHPFWHCRRQAEFVARTYSSPFMKLRDLCSPRPEMEIIQPFALSPWSSTLQDFISLSACSMKKGSIQVGLTAQVDQTTFFQWSKTVGQEENTNLYYTQLGGILEATTYISSITTRIKMPPYKIWTTIFTNNQSALQALAKPTRQSGQALLSQITHRIFSIHKTGMRVDLRWISKHDQTPGVEARRHYHGVYPTQTQMHSAEKTCHRGRKSSCHHPFGQFTRAIDKALPSKHTESLYDDLNREEASTLAQLRTGHARLNKFLFSINRTDSATCRCGHGEESVEHFLFQCRNWDHLRTDMTRAMGARPNDLSLALGGYSSRMGHDGKPLDGNMAAWKPNREVIHTVVKFALKTGRFTEDQHT